MGPVFVLSLIFVVLQIAGAQRAPDPTCRKRVNSCYGQGIPAYAGHFTEQSGPYSMIDIDGAAELPMGTLAFFEFRVFRLGEPITLQVWRHVTQMTFRLLYSETFHPNSTDESIDLMTSQLQRVEARDRMGFSYGGGGSIPIKYQETVNDPNGEPYMALECDGCAFNMRVGQRTTFTRKVQKQFRLRVCTLIPGTEHCTGADGRPQEINDCELCPAGPPGPTGPAGPPGFGFNRGRREVEYESEGTETKYKPVVIAEQPAATHFFVLYAWLTGTTLLAIFLPTIVYLYVRRVHCRDPVSNKN